MSNNPEKSHKARLKKLLQRDDIPSDAKEEIRSSFNGFSRLVADSEDLALVNALNIASNRGDSFDQIVKLLCKLTKHAFSSYGATVYLLSNDDEYLQMMNHSILPGITKRIKSLIGMQIPPVRIRKSEKSLYFKTLQGRTPLLFNDTESIRTLIAECTENASLRKHAPAIHRILGIKSVITIPLVSTGICLGVMDLSSKHLLDQDHVRRLARISEEFTVILNGVRDEKALQESELLLRNLLDSIPDLLVVLDGDLNILFSNWHEHDYVPQKTRDRKGKCYKAYMLRDKPCEPCHALDVLRTGQPQHAEMNNPITGRIMEINAYPIIGESGDVIMITEHVRDITDRKQMEERLMQSEKMEAIGQLAGGLAHDFNNQLTGIMSYADILRLDLMDNPGLAHYADNILVLVKRASDLTAQLLAFARKGKYLSVPVDINRIVFEVVSMLKHTIEKDITLKQQLNAHPCSILGDPSQLQNAILNLALNARDAMPQGGELCFSTDNVSLDQQYCAVSPFQLEKGRYIEVCVADTGIGIEEEIRHHMFEPFFTTKEKGKGTGMGLAAVYGTVNNHKGSIDVFSKIGHGTTFKLYFPLMNEENRPGVRRTGTVEFEQGTIHILLVDDEDSICKAVPKILQKIGYRTTSFRSGLEALDYYRKSFRTVDLVILDMVMPEISGKDVFIAMKKINPHIVALLSSGYSINGEAQGILEEGVNGFIQKPYRIEELSQKIAEILNIAVE